MDVKNIIVSILWDFKIIHDSEGLSVQNCKDVPLLRVLALKQTLLASAKRIYFIFIHAWLDFFFLRPSLSPSLSPSLWIIIGMSISLLAQVRIIFLYPVFTATVPSRTRKWSSCFRLQPHETTALYPDITSDQPAPIDAFTATKTRRARPARAFLRCSLGSKSASFIHSRSARYHYIAMQNRF